MSNTFIADGSYANLFAQSDAMIHDCSTFSCEYLYTNKPVLFLLKETNNTPLTELGASCLNMHYHAYQEKEIEEFINNVISGIDVLKKQRHYFVEHNLTKSDDTSTTSNIIQELNNLFISQ
jgi:CDP-glycerol glycerophosphotransferase (TagB/SpsB family)